MFGFPFPRKMRIDSGDKSLSFVLPQHPLSSPWNCWSWSQLFSAPSAVQSCAAPHQCLLQLQHVPKFVSLHLFVKGSNSGQFNACTYKGQFYKFNKKGLTHTLVLSWVFNLYMFGTSFSTGTFFRPLKMPKPYNNEKEKKQQNSQKQQTQDKLAERINRAIHFRSEIYCREVLSLTKCKGHLIYLDMVLFCHLTLKNSVPAGERERELHGL